MEIAFKNHSQVIQAEEVYQAPDGSQKTQVLVIIEKAKDWYHIITSIGIPSYLYWKSLKFGILRSLTYMIFSTNFSKTDGDRADSALCLQALPNLYKNIKYPKTLE